MSERIYESYRLNKPLRPAVIESIRFVEKVAKGLDTTAGNHYLDNLDKAFITIKMAEAFGVTLDKDITRVDTKRRFCYPELEFIIAYYNEKTDAEKSGFEIGDRVIQKHDPKDVGIPLKGTIKGKHHPWYGVWYDYQQEYEDEGIFSFADIGAPHTVYVDNIRRLTPEEEKDCLTETSKNS